MAVNATLLNSLIDDDLLSNSTNNLTNFNNFNGMIDGDFIENSRIGYYTPEISNDIINECSINCELTVFHINVRSLNANHLKLLDLLSLYNSPFNIIILTEIWSTNIEYFDNLFSFIIIIHFIK